MADLLHFLILYIVHQCPGGVIRYAWNMPGVASHRTSAYTNLFLLLFAEIHTRVHELEEGCTEQIGITNGFRLEQPISDACIPRLKKWNLLAIDTVRITQLGIPYYLIHSSLCRCLRYIHILFSAFISCALQPVGAPLFDTF